MRFLQLFNEYTQPGGEEKSVERIFRAVSSRHQVTKFRVSSAEWSGHGAPSKLQQVRLTWFHAAVADRAVAVSQREQCDAWIVHNAFPVLSPAIYERAFRHNIPIIQFLHNFRPFSVGGTLWFAGKNHPEVLLPGGIWKEVVAGGWQESRLKSLILGTSLAKLRRSGWLDSIHAWVGISDFVRDRFVEAGVPSERAFSLRHSWDITPRSPAVGAGDDGSFLFLGRLVEEKGIRVLLDAWRLLTQSRAGEVPRLLIGGDGPLRAEVEEAARRNPAIQFLGHVTGREKQRRIASCRAMLAPSVWWEPLGLVTYEAYDQGKPMLAAASGGLTETVSHGQTGFLHAPGQAHELAEHVQRLACDPVLARQLGESGREWLEQNASHEAWIKRFEDLTRFS